MNNRTKGISLAIITAVMWGIMGMFVRGLTGYAFTTFEISFFRCALAGGAYFLFLLFTKPSALKINLKGLVICLLYGAVAYSISFVSYSVAVSRIPVGVATVLMFMSPIWVAILGRFMFGEKLPKNEPENSLSPAKQQELVKFIEDSARFFGCQFVIATHSPFVLAIRGAKIYDLDEEPVDVKRWTELENVRAYYEFFKKHASEF